MSGIPISHNKFHVEVLKILRFTFGSRALKRDGYSKGKRRSFTPPLYISPHIYLHRYRSIIWVYIYIILHVIIKIKNKTINYNWFWVSWKMLITNEINHSKHLFKIKKTVCHTKWTIVFSCIFFFFSCDRERMNMELG